MEPEKLARWMKDMERRLHTMETATRIPSVSLAESVRGVQFTSSPGFRYIAGVKSWDAPSETLEALRFTAPSGRALVFIGARIEVGGVNVANEVGLGVGPVAPPTFDPLPNAVTVTGPTDPVGTSAVFLAEFPPASDTIAALTERLVFPTEDENCHVIEPYLCIMPL